MNIAWCLADQVQLDPTLDVTQLKEIGPIWGSWQTWRGCATDNVICHDAAQAKNLVKRNFQTQCNFYVHNDTYQFLDRVPDIKLYQGQFPEQLDHPDEIIAMHLSASQNNIVLLLGFDWGPWEPIQDRLLEHRAHVTRSLVYHTLNNNSNVQWVLVDHGPIMKELKNLDNLTQDTLPNVMNLLKS